MTFYRKKKSFLKMVGHQVSCVERDKVDKKKKNLNGVVEAWSAWWYWRIPSLYWLELSNTKEMFLNYTWNSTILNWFFWQTKKNFLNHTDARVMRVRIRQGWGKTVARVVDKLYIALLWQWQWESANKYELSLIRTTNHAPTWFGSISVSRRRVGGSVLKSRNDR